MDSKTPSGKGYRSFVKYVPFVDYPGKFARYKTLAKKQPEIFQKMVPDCFHSHPSNKEGGGGHVGSMLQTCVEKTSMGWFSVEQMRKAVEKYKQVRQNYDPRIGNCAGAFVGGGSSTYCEVDMIPHIRRGFAMDFDHLFTTEWARNNFQDDHIHFPLVKTPGHRHDCKFEIFETASGTLRPRVETPRFAQAHEKSSNKKKTDGYRQTNRPKTPYCPPAKTRNVTCTSSGLKGVKPPVIEVNTAGYSFNKKRKRKRHPRMRASRSSAIKEKNEKEKSETECCSRAESSVKGSASEGGMMTSKKSSEWTLVMTNNKKKKHKSDSVYKPTPPVF
jgi:hypothetical protein